jgi:hypothetical protein
MAALAQPHLFLVPVLLTLAVVAVVETLLALALEVLVEVEQEEMAQPELLELPTQVAAAEAEPDEVVAIGVAQVAAPALSF